MTPIYTLKGIRMAMKPFNIKGEVFLKATYTWRIQALLEHGEWRNFLPQNDFFPTAIPASPLSIDLILAPSKWLLK